MTRQMYGCILSRASWNAPVSVTDEAKSELMFWKANVRSLNDLGKSLNTKTFYEACLFADASSKGYGGYVELKMNKPENGENMYKRNDGKSEGYWKTPESGICASADVDGEQPKDLG